MIDKRGKAANQLKPKKPSMKKQLESTNNQLSEQTDDIKRMKDQFNKM